MTTCSTTSKNKIFTFKEQKSSLTLENKEEALSTKIEVDGCEISDNGLKCDFLHLKYDTEEKRILEIYIELKGQDLDHAIKQIERTISILSDSPKSFPKVSYIICTRSPMSSTEIQIYARKFKEKYNSKLIIKSSPFKDAY